MGFISSAIPFPLPFLFVFFVVVVVLLRIFRLLSLRNWTDYFRPPTGSRTMYFVVVVVVVVVVWNRFN